MSAEPNAIGRYPMSPGGRGRGRRRLGQQERRHDQHGNGQHLQHDEQVQQTAARLHAHVVHRRHDDDGQHRERRGAHAGPADQPQGVLGEGDGHRRHRAGLDGRQQRPPVEEPGQRMVGLAQVGVLAADPRADGAELRVGERAGQRDQPARHPRGEHLAPARQPPGDDGRVDEDAGADDGADHDHGGVEEAQLAAKAHLRELTTAGPAASRRRLTPPRRQRSRAAVHGQTAEPRAERRVAAQGVELGPERVDGEPCHGAGGRTGRPARAASPSGAYTRNTGGQSGGARVGKQVRGGAAGGIQPAAAGWRGSGAGLARDTEPATNARARARPRAGRPRGGPRAGASRDAPAGAVGARGAAREALTSNADRSAT